MVILGSTFLLQKRKLSWSDPDVADTVPAKHHRRQHREPESRHAAASPDTASTRLPLSAENQSASEENTAKAAVDTCSAGQRFTDRTGPLSNRRENESRKISLPSACGSPAMQDCSVSSSDCVPTADSP